MTNRRKDADKRPDEPMDWQTATFARSFNLSASHPEWILAKEKALGISSLRQELRRQTPAALADFAVMQRAQVEHWRRKAAILNLPDDRKKADHTRYQEWLRLFPDNDYSRPRNQPCSRSQWDNRWVILNLDWLGEWQRGSTVRVALGYSPQQFWKLTRALPAKSKRRSGRESLYSYPAVLKLLRVALTSVSAKRREVVADTIWMMVRYHSGRRFEQMRDLLLAMGASCPLCEPLPDVLSLIGDSKSISK